MLSPRIRLIDKMLPLKIKNLVLNPFELQINDGHFEFDFAQQRLGCKNLILIGPHQEVWNFSKVQLNDATREKFEKLRNRNERLGVQLANLELQVDDKSKNRTKDIEYLSRELLIVKKSLGLIRPIPHADYILFSDSGKKEILEYTCSIVDAMEYFVQEIFEGRKYVHVSHLKIDAPPFYGNKMGRKLGDSIDPSTPPNYFKGNFELKIDNLFVVIFEKKLVDRLLPFTKTLTISGVQNLSIDKKLNFKRVHLKGSPLWIDDLIRNLFLQEHREIGTYWSWDFHKISDKKRIKRCFAIDNYQLRMNPETRGTAFPSRRVRRLTDTSEAHLYCQRERDMSGYASWMLVFEVLPIDI